MTPQVDIKGEWLPCLLRTYLPPSGSLSVQCRNLVLASLNVCESSQGNLAALEQGFVFRPVKRSDKLGASVLSEKVVWQLIKPYVASPESTTSRHTTFGVLAQNSAGQLVENWSRFSSCWVMLQSKRQNGILEHDRI